MDETKKSIEKALQFLENIDALKDTYRKCLVISGKKHESTAEHSFSLAMAVLSLSPFSDHKIDLFKAVKMALFHDLAEALLGDTFHYEKSTTPQVLSEEDALKEILAPLSDSDLSKEIIELWQEFEYGQSAEALFLRGIDRFLPMYHNYKTKGHSWVQFKVTKNQALEKNTQIQESSKLIWEYTQKILDESQKNGWLF